LLDVTPLSLGIETLGGVFTQLIERNTTIPAKKSETFSTAADSQPSVEVHVLQGEREMASGNRTLGKFHLDGIPPAPRGVPQIEVTFDIDANGIVNVSAKDKATGKEQQITITSSSGLSEEEIKKNVSEAEAHGDEDKKAKAGAEARNQADSLVYQVEKTLSENRDKLSADDLSKVESDLGAAKEALKGGDTDQIKKAAEVLTASSHKLAEQIYRQASAASSAEGNAGAGDATDNSSSSPGGAEGDVIDAEVVDGGGSK
jgi:molecular chaperone DnaK